MLINIIASPFLLADQKRSCGKDVMKSIQSKFLIIVISGMLILATIISIVSVINISKILDKDADIITESVANTEALRLNQIIRDTEYAVESMKNYIDSTIHGIDDIKDSANRKSYTETAEETFDAIANSAEGLLSYYMLYSPELVDNYEGFFLGRSSKNAYFERLPLDGLGDWKSSEWLRDPMKTGKRVWLLPYEEPTIKATVITYVIPVFKNHQFIGIVGADLDFSVISDMVSGISVYDNGFAYLTDEEGAVLFSPVDDHMLDKTQTNHGFAEEHITIDNGMMLIIHADYSEIQRDSYRVMSIITLIVLLLTLIFISITYVLTNRIVKPLKKLTEAAEHLTEGETSVNLEGINSVDEVGVLARAFEKNAEKLHEYMDYINALAYKDPLTGVKNRTAYNEMSAALDVKIKIGYVDAFALLVADINGLKLTNDKYGHEVGNKLIKRASKIICDVFKHSPVYRVGGDEFAVLLKGEDFENLEALLNEMDSKSQEAFIIVDSDRVPVTIARATETFDPALDSSVEDLFSRADRKMYEDKNKKKNLCDKSEQ